MRDANAQGTPSPLIQRARNNRDSLFNQVLSIGVCALLHFLKHFLTARVKHCDAVRRNNSKNSLNEKQSVRPTPEDGECMYIKKTIIGGGTGRGAWD